MIPQHLASMHRSDFDAVYASHSVIPVARTIFADGETPLGVYRKLADQRPGSFLLESAAQGGVFSRYSFVGISSFGVLTEHGTRSLWQNYGLSEESAFPGGMPERPLDALSALYENWKTAPLPDQPPLTGGLVGLIGWDSVRQMEHLPNGPQADYSLPHQAMSFVRDLAAIDHSLGTIQLITTVLPTQDADSSSAWERAQSRLDELQSKLAKPAEAWLADVDLSLQADATARSAHGDFLAAVDTAKEHIRDGDVFQVVISQRFDLECVAEPLDVYRVLRTLNPSPYLYLLTMEKPDGSEYHIVGSSPEALVKINNGRAFTHPIAGSRPRGSTLERDNELANELLGDAKERSEHLMLVDLVRNDLSKVCDPASVEVTEFMRVERFSHIMHIVSSVEGTVREGNSPIDVFTATFPAGTLSGAPKPRALEIIDALEPASRGLYGGVVGYFGFTGDADLAIAIRTATIENGIAHVQAGAGFVADSVPQLEFEESQNKAAAPLRAVAIANAMKRIR